MIAEAVVVDPRPYTAQYELLRARVIGAQCEAMRPDAVGQPRGVGLALLLREGMPGWLKAVEAVIRASSAARTVDAGGSALPRQSAEDTDAPAWPFGVPRRDLTTLLASLVLSTHSLERSPTEGYPSWH